MFYCGVWCNDQAEYAAPVFPLIHGPGTRERTAMGQSLSVIADHFNHAYRNHVPYSIEIDGRYIGQLDHGDAGVYFLGAAKFLLGCYDHHSKQFTSSKTPKNNRTIATTQKLDVNFENLIPCVF